MSWDSPFASSDHQVAGIVSALGTQAIPLPGLFHDGGIGDEENPPTDTLALGAFSSGTYGELPFWALPSLGST
jgi:hypothetical protein